MKRFVQGDNRTQSFLLPEALDDYVTDTNPVRVVDVFVDELDHVKSNKNDANEAEAICEAMSRPGMRFFAVKTIEQQDLQAVLRARAGYENACELWHFSRARKPAMACAAMTRYFV
jgi:transposase